MTGDNQNTTVVGQAASEGKHGILSISIKEVGVLYSAYMPFLENGGLFIPTRKQYELGDEVFVLLNQPALLMRCQLEQNLVIQLIALQ